MQIDPHGWWLTVPMLAGLLWVYFQPADHAIKEFWRHLVRTESQGLASITGYDLAQDENRTAQIERLLFWAAVVALALGSAGSVGANLGLLPSA